ncbi:MAG: hypothetical protein Q3963_09745 [Coriobacteriaceae bacterium]|nr:hypothetical protein [Coriobacteriaceae bacterium]
MPFERAARHDDDAEIASIELRRHVFLEHGGAHGIVLLGGSGIQVDHDGANDLIASIRIRGFRENDVSLIRERDGRAGAAEDYRGYCQHDAKDNQVPLCD